METSIVSLYVLYYWDESRTSIFKTHPRPDRNRSQIKYEYLIYSMVNCMMVSYEPPHYVMKVFLWICTPHEKL